MISIITPAYNCQSFIIETYQSLKNQTLSDWEWLITEDSSTDDTRKIIAELAQEDARIKVSYASTNSGAAISRNRSIDRAGGEFIAFIDSDDTWFPEKLERQMMFMGESIDFSFTAYRIVNVSGQPTGKEIDLTSSSTVGYRDMLNKKATIGCSTVVLRRSMIGNLRMPKIKTSQDYAYWLSILKRDTRAHLLPEVLTSYRIHNGSLSRNKFIKAKQQWSIYRDIEGISLIRAIPFFVSYAYQALTR